MQGLLRRLFAASSNLFLAGRFVLGRAGQEHGVGHLEKLRLMLRITRHNRRVPSLTPWRQHIMLVTEILALPPSLQGDVVECGCYNGASTISLSLACALAGRRLFVCDSFAGLPEPEEVERHEIHDEDPECYLWEKGEFESEGGLEGVRHNVERFGEVAVCRFVKGFFEDTLEHLETDSIVMVFEDADLASSVKDCLEHLWPKLQYGCKFYCHEPWSIHVVGLFYDRAWWHEHLHAAPPGFFGSGGGVVAGFRPSTIGYAKKLDFEGIGQRARKIVHSGSRGPA